MLRQIFTVLAIASASQWACAADFCAETDNIAAAKQGFYAKRARISQMILTMNTASGLCEADQKSASFLFNKFDNIMERQLNAEEKSRKWNGSYRVGANDWIVGCRNYDVVANYLETAKIHSCYQNVKAEPNVARAAPLSPTPHAIDNVKTGKGTVGYGIIRAKLLATGWVPFHSPTADKCSDGDARCNGRPEMEVCAGTGLGECRFLWRKGDKTLAVCTAGDSAEFASYCATP